MPTTKLTARGVNCCPGCPEPPDIPGRFTLPLSKKLRTGPPIDHFARDRVGLSSENRHRLARGEPSQAPEFVTEDSYGVARKTGELSSVYGTTWILVATLSRSGSLGETMAPAKNAARTASLLAGIDVGLHQ